MSDASSSSSSSSEHDDDDDDDRSKSSDTSSISSNSQASDAIHNQGKQLNRTVSRGKVLRQSKDNSLTESDVAECEPSSTKNPRIRIGLSQMASGAPSPDASIEYEPSSSIRGESDNDRFSACDDNANQMQQAPPAEVAGATLGDQDKHDTNQIPITASVLPLLLLQADDEATVFPNILSLPVNARGHIDFTKLNAQTGKNMYREYINNRSKSVNPIGSNIHVVFFSFKYDNKNTDDPNGNNNVLLTIVSLFLLPSPRKTPQDRGDPNKLSPGLLRRLSFLRQWRQQSMLSNDLWRNTLNSVFLMFSFLLLHELCHKPQGNPEIGRKPYELYMYFCSGTWNRKLPD